MDAATRIAAVFDRLVAIGRGGAGCGRLEDRIVYYVVAARCEIDINGFACVYEQGLDRAELDVLVAGLRRLGEAEMADEFRRGVELLDSDGFYAHMHWNKVAPGVTLEIDAIGERIGSRLWDLDGKLAALLDDGAVA